MSRAGWTGPADIRDQLRRLWDSGRLLAATADDATLFPLRLRFRGPGTATLSDQFEAVRTWIHGLEDSAKPKRGFGYEIVWAEVNHRLLGRNRIPRGIVVPSCTDALRLLGKQAEADAFGKALTLIRSTLPELANWAAAHPRTVLAHAEDWPRILAVLRWFQANPRPGCYTRQIDLPGIDTKFLATRKPLLAELLDQVLPASAVHSAAIGTRSFEQRFGLRTRPVLIRFRLLDGLTAGGFSDLTVPVSELARWAPSVERVFITENEINGLAFPDVPRALVIFGLGYGLDRLGDIEWLRRMRVAYWGDIDTHGFVILDRLRAVLPEARSFLMDRATLLQHRTLWSFEAEPSAAPTFRLQPPEQSLLDDLRQERFGTGVRLEQERIGFGWLQQALDHLH